MATVEKWVGLGSAMAGLALLWSKMPEHVHEEVRNFITEWMPMVASYFNPYVQITISEYSDQKFRRSKLFDAIEAYLSESFAERARKLTADLGKDSDLPQPQVTLDDNQEITDKFKGARIWWNLSRRASKDRGTVINLGPEKNEPRLYRAVFHKRHRQIVLDHYLGDIVSKGRKLTAEKRQMRLFTNKRFEDVWSDVPFEHPATFNHLAMDPTTKKEITDDLEAFQEGKAYNSKVGKAWKRGYLLHGPPGTGKSTMISAMANLLKYDVYDLDLTSVRGNADLRKLFVETTGKSIIVIEDIDAIEIDITTKREDKKADGEGENHRLEHSDKNDRNKVTLSALLSIVDGLWSACGGERIFVFTTNHFERLDPALIRRGRMDMRIEMSYCRFEAFKVLAKNYISVTDHFLFGQIEQLLKENDMSPADVAHNLMCNKRKRDLDECLEEYQDECLAGLVETLKKAKKDSAATTSTQEQSYANRPRRSARVEKLKA